jgi:hypothetical protein
MTTSNQNKDMSGGPSDLDVFKRRLFSRFYRFNNLPSKADFTSKLFKLLWQS